MKQEADADADVAMTSSSPAPKLPMWIFLATDAVLLGAACAIGAFAPKPWSETTIMAVVVSAIAGAGVLIFWLMAYYERQKNEVLDDRQRALEALARTIESSAEQIGIGAAGLHEIAETAQKNMKQAEQLPHKLQEKISEFQAQLAAVNDEEREELEKELEELRGSETERLQSTFDRIARTTADFTKVEASIHQHLTAANEAVAKLSFGTADAIGKAQAAAEQALAHARQEAARAVGDATGTAIKSIESAKAAAVADLAAHFDTNVRRINEAIAQLVTTTDKLRAAAAAVPAELPKALSPQPPAPESDPAPTAVAIPAPTVAPEHPAGTESAASAKRSRKSKREEHVSAPEQTSAPASATAEPDPVASEPTASDPAASPAVTSSESVVAMPSEPAISQPEQIAAAEPAAQAVSAEPSNPSPEPVPVLASSAPQADTPPAVEPPKAVRKRSSKKHDDEQPALGLDIEDHKNGSDTGDGAGASSGVVERVLTSDGATRLVVTAYIGIGNRLFIRGNGPGLSWEKGVPLQFISIGKWRWETSEATVPVQYKLLKNDEQECSGLGELSIEPGHQNEVTAAF